MGKGKSNINKSSHKASVGEEKVLTSTGEIDLTGMPLVYGEKDPYLTGAGRATIEAFEAKKKGAKVENILLIDENGNSIYEKRGGRNSVGSPIYYNQQSVALSHNHPRYQPGEEGLLSGTFSNADLLNFVKYDKQITKRAVGKEGTYSISKTSSFDKTGFATFAKASSKQHVSTYRDEARRIQQSFKDKSISWSDYSAGIDKAFNQMLINCHNDLLANQEKYGYHYTLEK